MVDQKPPRETSVTIEKPEYIYLWHRIIGALAVLFLLIGLIGYGLFAWLAPPNPPAGAAVGGGEAEVTAVPETHQGTEEGAPQALPPPVESVEPPAKRAQQGPVASPIHAEPQPPEVEEPTIAAPVAHETLPRETAADPQSGTIVQEDSSAEITPASDREEVAGAATVPGPRLNEEKEEPRNVEGSPSGETLPTPGRAGGENGEGLFHPHNLEILSPAVKRFLLAQSVTNKEPRGGLGDIAMNAKGIAAVYSFSEVIGLKGEVLEYRWLHEGKPVLRISVPVAADRWRSHAQKDINRGMKGDWRVELRDSADRLLASADFLF